MTGTRPTPASPGPGNLPKPDDLAAPNDLAGSGGSDGELRDHIATVLERARHRTMALTDVVDDADLTRQHSPLMSPLVWDLAHVASVEELWLLRELGGQEPMQPQAVDRLYNAFEHPRNVRPRLPLLDPDASRRYVGEVRARVLDLLDSTPLRGRR